MDEDEIRAEIEALGLDAAPRIARRFERLKPSPWRERFADWWERIDWFPVSAVVLVVAIGGLFCWAARSDAEGSREMLRACESGDLDACEIVRKDEGASDYNRLRAERKLLQMTEATK